MKLTDWFGPDVKPVRIGVYQIQLSVRGDSYAYWSGTRWGACTGAAYGDAGIEIALEAELRNYEGANQNKTWRGLAEAPQ